MSIIPFSFLFFSFLLIFLFPFIFIFSLFLSFPFLPLPYFPLPSRKPHEVALADLPPASSVPVAGLHSPRTAPPLRCRRSSRRPFFFIVLPTPLTPARMRRPSSALPLAVHRLSVGVHLRRPPSVSTPRVLGGYPKNSDDSPNTRESFLNTFKHKVKALSDSDSPNGLHKFPKI
jgi:hypothetical protein